MRAAWIVVLALLAGAGAWWLLSREPGSAGTGEPGTVDGRPAEPASPGSMGKGPSLEGAAPRPAGALRGAFTLRGTVLRDGQKADALVQAQLLPGGASLIRDSRRSMSRLIETWFSPEAPDLGAPEAEGRAAAGAFELPGLPAGLYRVLASTEDGLSAEAFAALAPGLPAAPVTLTLARAGETLEGSVRFSDGTPVRGMLFVEPSSGQGEIPGMQGGVGPVRADAEGRFVLRGLRAGRTLVRVLTDDGVLAIGPSVVLPASEPYAFVLAARTARVSGTVVSLAGQAPVAGAMVLAAEGRGEMEFVIGRTATGADGSFSLPVGALPVTLMAMAEGFAPLEGTQTEKPEGNVLRLAPLTRVSGRVTAAAGGAAVAGAGVEVQARRGPGQPLSGVTDAEGRYALDGVEGAEVLVQVRGGGWVSAGLETVREPDYNPFLHKLTPGEPLIVDLLAVPARTLTGRVLDDRGAPVEGARVSVSGVSLGGRQIEGLDARGGPEGAVSAADGSFTLGDLPPGALLTVMARASDESEGRAGPLAVDGAGPVEVRLVRARFVTVTVLSEEDGKPVVGAAVTLTGRTGGSSSRVGRGWLTDGQGRVRAGPAPAGTLSASVRGEGLAAGQGEVAVPDSDGEATELAVTVRAARGGEIRGRVLLPDGAPAVRARVRVVLPRGNDSDSRSARTDASGAFVLKGLPAGEHELLATHERDGAPLKGSARAAVGAKDVVLTLEDGSRNQVTLTVRVLAPDGTPVPRANVRLWYGDEQRSSSGARDGRAVFREDRDAKGGLAEAWAGGRLSIEVGEAEGDDRRPLPLGPARVGPLAPDAREVEVRLPAEKVIEGRVLDPEGQGVAGVQVRAEREQAQGRGRGTLAEARTEADGRFRLGRLGDGALQVRLGVPPAFLTPEALATAAGGAPLEVRLVRGAAARVRVLDASGAPVVGARVSASFERPSARDSAEVQRNSDESERLGRSAQSGADGVALLQGLDPQRGFQLSVTPATEREDLLPWSQTAWTPADLELRLERGYTVSGFVRDATGKPVPNALVYVRRDPKVPGWEGTGVGPDGAFRIKGLREGPVGLTAVGSRHAVFSGTEEPQLTVAAGTTGVLLSADPGVDLVVRLVPGARRTVRLLRPFGNGTWGYLHELTREPGADRVVFQGLTRDTVYMLWSGPDADGVYGLLRDVRPGGEVSLPLERGGTLRGRIVAPPGTTDLALTVGGQQGLRIPGQVEPDGRYEVRGIPPGTWDVQAQGRLGDAWLSAQGEAQAGGTLDLRLEPRR